MTSLTPTAAAGLDSSLGQGGCRIRTSLDTNSVAIQSHTINSRETRRETISNHDRRTVRLLVQGEKLGELASYLLRIAAVQC